MVHGPWSMGLMLTAYAMAMAMASRASGFRLCLLGLFGVRPSSAEPPRGSSV